VSTGIDSTFIALRVIFSDECVPRSALFKKRFADTTRTFLRDVQEVEQGDTVIRILQRATDRTINRVIQRKK